MPLYNNLSKPQADSLYVSKQNGYNLSKNDYTDTEKTKVSNILTSVSQHSYTPIIKPSPTYNYALFMTSEQAEIESWFVAKSIKRLSRIGVFIYKSTVNGSIANSIRVQVVHSRSGVSTVLLNTTISASNLQQFNTTGIVGGYANYELLLDLTIPITLAVGDTYFVSVQSQDRLTPIFGNENALLSTGDWNDGSFCYRLWQSTWSSGQTTYSAIPALPTTNPNYNAVHFYDYDSAQDIIINVASSLQAVQNTVATKAYASTTTVFTRNLADKTKYVNGKGVGTDGVIFSLANIGMMQGVPVTAGTNIVITGCPSFRGLRFENSSGTLVSLVGSPVNGTSYSVPTGATQITFQVHFTSGPQNADTVQVEVGTTATDYIDPQIKYVNKINGLQIYGTSNSSVNLVDFEVLSPTNIYFSNPDIQTGRKEPLLLYLQRFFRDKVEVWINKAQNLYVASKLNINAATVDQETITFTLNGSGYLTKNISINRVSTKSSNMVSKFPKVLYIGDSITTNRQKNGITVGAGALWSMAKEIALKNKVDNGNTGHEYLCVGRNNTINSTITYSGSSITVKGGAEGVGGWTAHTYLRHPFRFWPLVPSGGWDILGLVTTQGRAYTGSDADKLLIMQTCYGVNAPVVSANSYALLIAEGQITDLGAWTNSTSQQNAVQAYIDGIANGTLAPQNPFFDYNKTGTNRFSVAKYLSRYKTLNDDGVTRLTVGSTAGTLVTNATSYDVCTPTHVVIGLGENDRLFSSNYVAICDDIMELANEWTTQLSTCQVGICLTQMPGPMFPERHESYFGPFYQNHHNPKYDLYKELNTRFGILSSQVTNRKFLIPTWHCMTPLSHSSVSEQVNEGSPNGLIQVGVDDYNHPGYYANRSGGSQIYGWVAYTNTLS